jgi:hypothetical protein
MGLNEKISQLRVKHLSLKKIKTRLLVINHQIDQQIAMIQAIKADAPAVHYDPVKLDAIAEALGKLRPHLQKEADGIQVKIDAIQRRL